MTPDPRQLTRALGGDAAGRDVPGLALGHNPVDQAPQDTNCGPPSMADAPFHVAPDNGPEPVIITLAGDPQGKGRARASVRGGHVGHYTPDNTRTYEGMIRTAATIAMGNWPPLEGPVEFIMRAIFAVPASWSQRRRTAALGGLVRPTKKPDLDDIAKAWNDALNGVVYRDDSQVVKATFEKRYGPQPLVVATVRVVT